MCSTLMFRLCIKYFSFVFICKYLLTAGLRKRVFNVTQSWPGILKCFIFPLSCHKKWTSHP